MIHGRGIGLSLLICGATQAPIVTPLPAPLTELVSSNAQARLSVIASGLADARNLRLLADGSLRLDAPGRSLEYRITPYPEGGADILLSAREMHDGFAHAELGAATLADLEWVPRGEEAGEADCFELPRESLAAAKAIASTPRTEAALAPDGTLFVAALDAGIVYRVTLSRDGQ